MKNRRWPAGLAAMLVALCVSLPVRAAEPAGQEASGWIAPRHAPTFSDAGTAMRSLRTRGAALPASYGFSVDADGDLTVAGQTPVRDQGRNGICWAFATTSAMEANALRSAEAGAPLPDYSELHMVYSVSQFGASRSDVSNREQGYASAPEEGGNLYYAASYLMRGTALGGTLAEETDPYVYADVELPFRSIETTKALGACKTAAVGSIPIIQAEKTSVYATGNDASVRALQEIKKAVMAYGAAVTSIYWSTTSVYYNASEGAYYVDRMLPANHAITVVGWDDGYPAENFSLSPPGDGAWLIKNSWGTGGDTGYRGSGYYWVSYYDGRIGEWTYALDGVTAYDPKTVVHEYDYRIDDDILCGGAYCVAFRKQTAAERVDALRISVNSPAEFDLSVCADYLPESGPADNAFASLQHVTLERPGFYTVPLEEPALITGDCFALRVEMASTDCELYTYLADAPPLLRTETGAYDAVCLRSGAGGGWQTVPAETAGCSLPCIKAVCTDLSGNSRIRITGVEPDGEGLAVTVDTDMAKPVMLAAAGYRNGQMATGVTLVTEPLCAQSERFLLPLTREDGLTYRVFVLDAASLAPLTDKAAWTPE